MYILKRMTIIYYKAALAVIPKYGLALPFLRSRLKSIYWGGGWEVCELRCVSDTGLILIYLECITKNKNKNKIR